MKQAFDMAVREDGWAHLGLVGKYLSQLDPGFDTRTYGFKQLSQLIKAYPKIFELKEYKPNADTTIFTIKLKD